MLIQVSTGMYVGVTEPASFKCYDIRHEVIVM